MKALPPEMIMIFFYIRGAGVILGNFIRKFYGSKQHPGKVQHDDVTSILRRLKSLAATRLFAGKFVPWNKYTVYSTLALLIVIIITMTL